jgi:cytochrome P450
VTSLALPPTAGGVPFFGNALAYLQNPLGFLREMRLRHGDVVRIALGPLKVTLVSHPDVVEDILVTRNKLWQKDAYLQKLRPVLGDGLLASEGDFWRRQRRLAQPAFHRERTEGYGAIMVAHAARMASRWREGEVRELHDDMMQLTMGIVAEALFGADVGDHAREVGEALEDTLAVAASPYELFFPVLESLPTPSRRRFDAGVAKLDAVVYGLIAARRKETQAGAPERHDLLALLEAARDDDGARMSEKQLRDECMTLFLAGHETTALTLSWTFLLLSQHPAVEAALHRELADVLGDRLPTVNDLPALTLTSHIVQESLRLYPPAWSLGREAREDIDVGGYLVPKGSQVWFCPWSIQRDARWYEAPDAFRPERWQHDFAKTLPKYAYFPFGGGPRLCIGQAFAQMEVVLVLATLAQRFRVAVLGTPAATPEPSVTLRPKHGLRARLRVRR